MSITRRNHASRKGQPVSIECHAHRCTKSEQGIPIFSFVGVAEDYLRRKAAKLEERMRSLEDALAIVQINTSTEQHPLLTKKWTIEDANDENDGDNTSTTAEYGVIDALGSLHLDGDLQSGVTRFFGPSGGAEVRTRHLPMTR